MDKLIRILEKHSERTVTAVGIDDDGYRLREMNKVDSLTVKDLVDHLAGLPSMQREGVLLWPKSLKVKKTQENYDRKNRDKLRKQILEQFKNG